MVSYGCISSIQTAVNKGHTFVSPEHALTLEVRFYHLEGTLIPFGNVDQHCDGKALDIVPLTLEMGPELPVVSSAVMPSPMSSPLPMGRWVATIW